MQHLLLLFAVFLLACQSKPAAPAPQTLARKEESKEETATEGTYPSPGIVIGENVRIRQEASLQSAVIGKASTGQMLSILEVTDSSYAVSSNVTGCDEYPMIRVRTGEGQTGWIFGAYVYLIMPGGDSQTAGLRPFTFDHHHFAIKLAEGFGVGAFDGEELTGCDEFYPVLLWDTQTGQAFPVALADPNKSYVRFKYWNLESDEGGEEHLNEVAAKSAQTLSASICNDMMEGYATYQIDISKKGEGYVGTVSKYRRFDTGSCKKED